MTEKQLHKQICNYLHLQYPKVIFTTDASGLRMSIGEAVRVKKLRSSNNFPDIMIFETVKDYYNYSFCGLFLEIKIKSPYKKNSTEILAVHKNQNEFHKQLRKRGYIALFVWTFEMAKQTIDKYLKK